MPRRRNRRLAAARRSMLQRGELHRRLDVAKAAFKPSALVDRGKYRIGDKVDDTAHAMQRQFRDNRSPIAIAAAAGAMRSEERRLGQECGRTCRSQLLPYNLKKKHKTHISMNLTQPTSTTTI